MDNIYAFIPCINIEMCLYCVWEREGVVVCITPLNWSWLWSILVLFVYVMYEHVVKYLTLLSLEECLGVLICGFYGYFRSRILLLIWNITGNHHNKNLNSHPIRSQFNRIQKTTIFNFSSPNTRTISGVFGWTKEK